MSKIEVVKNSLIHQYKYVNSEYKYPALIGGLGSGKTDAGIARTLKLKYMYPTLNQAYYMPDYNLIRDRGMSGFEEELTNIGQPYKANYSDKIIKLENKGNIYFRTMDNPSKIVSYEVADSQIDELDTMKPDKAKEVYRKIRERNRQKKPNGMPNTIGVITTPDYGTEGFVWELLNRCIDKKTMDGMGNYDLINNGMVDDYHLIEACTADNPFLPKEYLADILDMYDPILANLFTKGKMVSLTADKVYRFYNKMKHSTLRQIEQNDELHIGIDFNVGGCACVVHIEENGKIYAVDEIAPKDTHAMAIELSSRYKGHKLYLYPDSSGDNDSSNASRTDLQILEDEVRTPIAPYLDYPNANPPIRDRVNSMNNLFSKDVYYVNYLTCPRYSHALSSQGWGDDGKPEKSNNHKDGAPDDYNDGAGYYINRRFGLDRPTFTNFNKSFG